MSNFLFSFASSHALAAGFTRRIGCAFAVALATGGNNFVVWVELRRDSSCSEPLFFQTIRCERVGRNGRVHSALPGTMPSPQCGQEEESGRIRQIGVITESIFKIGRIEERVR